MGSFVPPPPPPTGADESEQERWKRRLRQWNEHKDREGRVFQIAVVAYMVMLFVFMVAWLVHST